MLKQQIDADLKTAMLAGDKAKVSTLRSLKSAILYVEVAQNARENGLDDEAVLQVLAKEAKKRQESIEMYQQAGETERANFEIAEKVIIDGYLPAQISDEELAQMIDTALEEAGSDTKRTMGELIGQIKAEAKGRADGQRIAQMVIQRMQQRSE